MSKLSPEAQTQVDELESMAVQLAEKIQRAEQVVRESKEQIARLREQIKAVIRSDGESK